MAKNTTKGKRAKKETSTRSPRSRRAKSPRTSAAEPTEAEIRARAYEIYVSGRGLGDPVADWLEAERELRAATLR